MAAITFTVRHDFDAPARAVWDELVDWSGHADWIPATRMDLPDGDQTAPGYTFTAYTGYGPLTLEDRMEVVRCDWDDQAGSGDCEVRKLGPVLEGRAGFTVTPAGSGSGSTMSWTEDVAISWVPGFAAPLVAKLSAFGFKMGMRRLASTMKKKASA